MTVDSRQIIEAGEEALRRASAPICYLHRDGTQGPFAVVVEIEMFGVMAEAFREVWPDGDLMNHGHIEGDEDFLDAIPETAKERLRREARDAFLALGVPADEFDAFMADVLARHKAAS